MKVLLVIVVLLLVCALLFVVGIFSPQGSRRMQTLVGKLAQKGENKGDETSGRAGDITSAGMEKARRAADASARGGRRVNEKIRGD